jgi:hypothetical protein
MGDWVSLLAPSPDCFSGSGEFIQRRFDYGKHSTYVMTNAGLSINLPIVPATSFVFAALNVVMQWGNESRVYIPIGLDQVEGDHSRRPFPPAPLMFPQNYVCGERDFLVRSRPRFLSGTFGSPWRGKQAPTSQFGIILTFDDAESLTEGRHLEVLETREEKHFPRSYEPIFTCESYPSHLLDKDQSFFIFPDIEGDGRQIVGGLVKVGILGVDLCVLLFALTGQKDEIWRLRCSAYVLSLASWVQSEDKLQQLLKANIDGHRSSVGFAQTLVGLSSVLEVDIGNQFAVSEHMVTRSAHLRRLRPECKGGVQVVDSTSGVFGEMDLSDGDSDVAVMGD